MRIKKDDSVNRFPDSDTGELAPANHLTVLKQILKKKTIGIRNNTRISNKADRNISQRR